MTARPPSSPPSPRSRFGAARGEVRQPRSPAAGGLVAGDAALARSHPGRPPARCGRGSRRRSRPSSPTGDAFLASATPAAGKTTFGLRVAHQMLEEGRVGRVAVIAPTTHICRQWAADAARYGIDLEPNRPNSAGPSPATATASPSPTRRWPPGRACTAAAVPSSRRC